MDMPTNTGENPTDLDELILLKNKSTIPPFESIILHCRTHRTGLRSGVTEYFDHPENPGTGCKLMCKIDLGSVPALRQALKVGPLHADCDTRHLCIEPTTSTAFLNTSATEPFSPAPLVTVPYLLSLKHPLNHL